MSERDRVSSTYNTALICCPFFIAHSKKEIICEGMIEGSRLITSFEDPDGKKFHQMNYCEKCYKRCEMYCSIQHWKWEEE